MPLFYHKTVKYVSSLSVNYDTTLYSLLLPFASNSHSHHHTAHTRNQGLFRWQSHVSSGAPSEVACNFRTLPRLGGLLRHKPMQRSRDLSQPRRGGACVSRLRPLASTIPRRRDHGICTNNVRMQTKRLLLGTEKLSAQLTDEVVHEHTALASYNARPTGFVHPR